MQKNDKTAKRLTMSVVIIVILSFCLTVTTFALVYSMVSVDNNLFVTGTVRINLNGGEPVIRENEFLFEPGMTVKKNFFVKNESSCEVYYKLYFQNTQGGLADVLEIKICDGDTVLYEGTPITLNQDNVLAANEILRINEIRNLQIYFHFPEDAGNRAQNLFLTFDFAADAVQTKNNTSKEFS